MSLTIAAILAAARTPRPVTPCPTCGVGAHVCAGCGGLAGASVALANACRCRPMSHPAPCSCAGREAVKVLCADLTDAELRAEIERIEAGAAMLCDRCGHLEERHSAIWCKDVLGRTRLGCQCAGFAPGTPKRDARHARAALETERDRRSREAAIATLPEERR